MKTRLIITLGIVAFIAVVAWTLLAFAKATSVPSDQFADTLRKHPEITMVSQMTRAPKSIPLLLRMRFPKQSGRGFIGFPDRSDAYVLNIGGSDIECVAQVRRDNVCYVTLSGNTGVETMRHKIQDWFPGLTVD